jgi:hypothetical protein
MVFATSRRDFTKVDRSGVGGSERQVELERRGKRVSRQLLCDLRRTKIFLSYRLSICFKRHIIVFFMLFKAERLELELPTPYALKSIKNVLISFLKHEQVEYPQ